MEHTIKISVIMPIYNAYDYLRPAIESVLDQTLSDIELICIDDGSTDDSYALVKEYAAKDERIRIVTENNAGPAHARNNGIRRARGEYVAFLDADDFFEPTLLETLYTMACEKSLDIAIADYDLYQSHDARFTKSIPADCASVFSDGRVASKNEIPDYIYQSTDGYVWNKLFRRTFLEEKGLLFPIEAKMFEDVYFVCTALSLAERIARTENILLHHRVYSDQLRIRTFRKHYDSVPVIYGMLREFLMHHGMYLPLIVSYTNLVASRCYKILNILPSDTKEEFWDLLHAPKTLEALGFTEGAHEMIEDEDIRAFLIDLQLYTYRQAERNKARGKSLDPDRIQRRLRFAKTRTAIGTLFHKKNNASAEED